MNVRTTLISIAAASLIVVAPAMAGDTPAPDGAKAQIINLKNGDTVSSPVLVQFGLSGMGIAPAGLKDIPDSGHHHLLIDVKVGADAMNRPLPSDANHKHFGKGQTEALIELAPGKHTLQLLLGDWKHMPHTKPVMSEAITITVK